ncbi:MAG: hypothetical protein AVDCRST_MAG85-205, partial [uncultured Solirubrobacteraceae bacterium]
GRPRADLPRADAPPATATSSPEPPRCGISSTRACADRPSARVHPKHVQNPLPLHGRQASLRDGPRSPRPRQLL